MVHESVRERQGQVQKTGDSWENEVVEIVLPKIKGHNLNIVKGKKEEIRSMFWEQLKVPTKRRGVWGDIDLIVYNTKNMKVISVIAKDTSF